MELFIKTLVWILCWVVIKGIFYLFADKGNHYLTKYRVISLYFLISSLFVVFFFQYELFSLTYPTFYSFTSLLIFLGFITSVYLFSPKLFTTKHLEENTLILAKMDLKYLLAKSFEILFQQTLIVSLTILLYQAGFSPLFLYLSFSLLFGTLHLPLIKIRGKHFGIYFTIAAFIAGVLFPYLVLSFSQGYIYSYMLHWGFYVLTGVIVNLVRRFRI